MATMFGAPTMPLEEAIVTILPGVPRSTMLLASAWQQRNELVRF